jgi:2-polyprenyl-3-methyl-5-hydroxy-6-metoxy-1,4-benzoquinol methylase
MNALLKAWIKETIRSNTGLSALAFRLSRLGMHSDLAAADVAIDGIVEGGVEPNGSHLDILKRHFVKSPVKPPPDPFSAAYHQWSLDQYEAVARRGYAHQNEIAVTTFDYIRDRFMPYMTQDPQFTGHYLQSQAFVIANLPLKPGMKVLEMGAGWGNLSLAMALLGASVTAVEINPDFCKLIEHRLHVHGRSISVVHEDFVSFAEKPGESYDIVVFEASFHHCSDHLRLLAALAKRLNKGGTIVFANEPFFKPGNPALPYPWGLRLDLASLVYVRRYGWLELGFTESHMTEACRRLGLTLKRVSGAAFGAENLFLARDGS